MKAYVKNLKQNDARTIMYCTKCGAEYSANKSDYFWASETDKFTHHGRIMELVTKHTIYQPV